MNKICLLLSFVSYFSLASAVSEADQARLAGIDARIQKLQSELRSRVGLYHRLSHAPAKPQSIWSDDGATGDDQRKSLQRLMRLELRSLAKNIDAFEAERDEILFGAKTLALTTGDLLGGQAGGAPTPQIWKCNVAPVAPSKEKVLVKQGFGDRTDETTGIKVSSPGWWVVDVEGPVRACANGTLRFAGEVPGRGFVVLIDHGSAMTLYANLNPDLSASLVRGQVIEAGAPLGMSSDRVYFEVRQSGRSVDPRQVLAKTDLEKFQL